MRILPDITYKSILIFDQKSIYLIFDQKLIMMDNCLGCVLNKRMKKFLTISPVKHENLQSVVYRQICNLILEGEVEPGQSMTVAVLAEALDVSPMPVREALSRLTHSGVLTTVSGRTLGVPILSVEDLKELYRVRLEIEGTAVEWALQRRTELFVITLREILVDLDDAEKRSDNKAFIAGNYRFHEAIYKQSGSEILLGIIRTLWLRVSPYFHFLDAQGHLQLSNDCHKVIVDAIENGDTETARSALVEDIERARTTLTKMN